MTTTDQARMIGFALSSALRRRLGHLAGMFATRVPFDGRAPLRLLIAPHDLRTADATIANDIYRGRLSLCGSVAEITAVSPFMLTPPSVAWQEELLSFSWLRHLHAAGDAISRVHARALISDWIALQNSGRKVGWEPHILARRIISWLAHSPLYLENAEPQFYRVVMRSLGRQLRYLARNARSANDGLPRLTAYIALSYATLCISDQERLQLRAARLLSSELDRQVLPDGGHISRNPAATLELLLDLLPLRQTFISREIVPPRALMSAIDKMLPMVRFFRHGDGDFALFNGMGRTPVGAVPAVLAYDENRGKAPDQAPHCGYQRLAAGDAVILMDTGTAPPPALSERAHAGYLSFEFSLGPYRMITNCGVSDALKPEWNTAARTTPAHSTVTIADISSSRFVTPRRDDAASPMIAGPRRVEVMRRETDDEIVVEASHDGYHKLGILHRRRLQLSKDGFSLEGHDRLIRSGALFSRNRPFAIRFHLHPNVKATLADDGRSVLLTLPEGKPWRFTVLGANLRIEESVFLADPKGACRIDQIVASGECGNEVVVKWNFTCEGAQRAPRVRRAKEGESETAILPQTVDPAKAVGGPGKARPLPARPAPTKRSFAKVERPTPRKPASALFSSHRAAAKVPEAKAPAPEAKISPKPQAPKNTTQVPDLESITGEAPRRTDEIAPPKPQDKPLGGDKPAAAPAPDSAKSAAADPPNPSETKPKADKADKPDEPDKPDTAP
ncbi:MAG: heparinase II/III domain-containing protein, partial [Alphaproteobacteria bacterium]